MKEFFLSDRINRITWIFSFFPGFLKKPRKYNIHKERKGRRYYLVNLVGPVSWL